MNNEKFIENPMVNPKIDDQAFSEQKASTLFENCVSCTKVQSMDQVTQEMFRCSIWEELTDIGNTLCSFLYLWRDEPMRLSFFPPSYDNESELWHYLYAYVDRLQNTLEHWWEKEIERVAVKHAASEQEDLDFEEEIPDDIPW
jgi:hypothetical protein